VAQSPHLDAFSQLDCPVDVAAAQVEHAEDTTAFYCRACALGLMPNQTGRQTGEIGALFLGRHSSHFREDDGNPRRTCVAGCVKAIHNPGELSQCGGPSSSWRNFISDEEGPVHQQYLIGRFI
jgi:hypothetical protein